MSSHLIAFWNLENLFGPEHHPHRIDWVKEQVKADLVGWTPALYQKKLAQLASVIARMNNGTGPDILGVCEVEDAYTLADLAATLKPILPNRDYATVYASNDLSSRGIDTAFLYDKTQFSVDPLLVFNHFVMRRTGTRDILQATFKRQAGGRELVVMANHWPSRLGGDGAESSAGFRATAGETLAYWHERIFEKAQKKNRTPVLALGDLNDDPWDRSVTINALATRERGDVERAIKARFYNFAWEYLSSEVIDIKGNKRLLEGSLYFKDDGNLFDQIFANGPLLDGKADSGFKVVNGSAGLITFPDMVSSSVGQGPIKFGLPKGDAAKEINENGFSDHFPVGIMVTEV